MIRRVLILLSVIAFLHLFLFPTGCQATSDWLRQPATTQPLGPTREDVIKDTAATIGAASGNPVLGTVLSVGVPALLLGLHELAARKRNASRK